MDYLSSFYRKLKIGVSSVGIVGSTAVIIVGAVVVAKSLGIVFIVGGSLWLASSGFNLFDSIRVHSLIEKDVKRLKNNIKEFEDQNIELQQNVDELKGDISKLQQVKNQFIHENKKLAGNVEESKNQLKKLTNIKTQYQKNINRYEHIVETDKENEMKLKKDITQLEKLKSQFVEENNKLKELNMTNLSYISQLENLKDQYISENKKLQELNIKNEKYVKELEGQVKKLGVLYKNTKELLKNLAEAGDEFSQFSAVIGTSAESIDHSAGELDQNMKKMEFLLDKMKEQKFKDLDKDGDNQISEEEFLNAINNA